MPEERCFKFPYVFTFYNLLKNLEIYCLLNYEMYVIQLLGDQERMGTFIVHLVVL